MRRELDWRMKVRLENKLVGMIGLILAGGMAVTGCGNRINSKLMVGNMTVIDGKVEQEGAEREKHAYDWSKLEVVNGIKHYQMQNGSYAKIGIDISMHQGYIDWKQLGEQKIDYAMIRLGYRGYNNGEIQQDENYDFNIKEALNNNIGVGVYFFSQAVTIEEAKEEARFTIERLKNYKVDYPVVFDMEEVYGGRASMLSRSEVTEITRAFCETIEEAGYKAMIYGNKQWLTERVDMHSLGQYEIWLAQYNSEPTFAYEFKMWQYTDEGKIFGINEDVDLNLYFE